MGITRDIGTCEIDLIKEMAEGLGSTGLRIEDILDKASVARETAEQFVDRYRAGQSNGDPLDISLVNEAIRAYNTLVERAEDALRWLLIQREACGFRTHRNVHLHYPIPEKMKLVQ